MKRSALPLVWGRNGLVSLCRAPIVSEGGREVPRDRVVPGVVGEDPLDAHPAGGEEGRGIEHEPGARRPALVVEGADVGDPAHVVDRDVQVVVAAVGAGRAGHPTADPVAAAVGDAAELLDVDVEQLARSLADVADRDARRSVLVGQAGQPVTGEDVADGRAWDAHDRRQAVWPEAVFVTGREDRIDPALGQGARHPMGP